MSTAKQKMNCIRRGALIWAFLFFLVGSMNASDHFDGKRFFNPGDKEGPKSFWQVLKWKLTSSVVPWPDKVTNKNYPFRALAPNEKVSATFINHATFLLQFPGLNVLTDPLYSERASPMTFAGPKRVRPPGIPFDSLPPIDVVLVSHNHYDHLDVETLRQLDGKFHPLFLVPLGDGKLLLENGIQNVKEMDWWNDVTIKDIRFTFTPSKHWSARGPFDKNESLWGSYMVRTDDFKIYHAGDTGYGPHFLEIKNRLGKPDLALLPIGAYKPRWFMQSYHMDPSESVRAHQDLESKKSIGMHFGTFQLTDEGIDEPVRDLKIGLDNKKISTEEFLILEEGQTYTVH